MIYNYVWDDRIVAVRFAPAYRSGISYYAKFGNFLTFQNRLSGVCFQRFCISKIKVEQLF